MIRSALSQLQDYLSRSTGIESLPPIDIPEERASDLAIASFSSTARKVTYMEIDPFPKTRPLFRFFVDGVQRTAAIAEAVINHVRVPVHLSHLIVGAMERDGTELRPSIVREVLVLLLPYQALSAADQSWSGRVPPGRELNWQGSIYNLVQRSGGVFYSDTSVELRLTRSGRPEILLQAGDLVRSGEVRRKALDRAKELLRIMETGLVWELRSNHQEDWILLDGPIAPLLKYGRLVSPELMGLEEVSRPDVAFDFLHRVVGAVKKVQIVPSTGLGECLKPSQNFPIPVYRFVDVTEDNDAVAREILSAYVWLRRELAHEIPALWSPVGGIARFDIPIPCLLTDNDRDRWLEIRDGEISDLLSSAFGNQMLGTLKRILESIILERWPLAVADRTRMLTEIFSIAETEAWLTAQLMSIYEFRSLVQR